MSSKLRSVTRPLYLALALAGGSTVTAAVAQDSTTPLKPSAIVDIDRIPQISEEVWNAAGPFGIFLEDEVPHLGPRMTVDPTSWEDLGFYSVLKSGDTEIYLAAITMYSQGNPSIAFMATRGQYGDHSAIVPDTEMLRGHVVEPISVTRRDKLIVWQSPSLQTIAAPPVWQQVGEFTDAQSGKTVSFDLLFKQFDQEYWPYWPGYNPGRTGKGVHAPVTVEGVVTIDGTRYPIEQGYSTYERAVMPTRHSTAMGRQDWFNAFCGDEMNFLFYQNGYGATQGFLSAGTGPDRKYYGFGDVGISVTGHWRSPQLGRDVPSSWKITGASIQGAFEAHGVTYAPLLLGTASGEMGFDIFHHLFSVEATFTPADGSPATTARCIGTNEARFPAPGAVTQQ